MTPLADVAPLLTRLLEALGSNAAARLLGADRAQISRWAAGTESIGQELGRRIIDLHDVLTRIMRVYAREAAAMWLVGSEPITNTNFNSSYGRLPALFAAVRRRSFRGRSSASAPAAFPARLRRASARRYV